MYTRIGERKRAVMEGRKGLCRAEQRECFKSQGPNSDSAGVVLRWINVEEGKEVCVCDWCRDSNVW